MNRLTLIQYQKAVEFLMSEAQDIDKAMYEYFFEGLPLDDVVAVLQSYQNEDGGFGWLDYDIECPVSCLKTTESACRYIFALNNIPASHPMIQKLIPYIIDNYNSSAGEWDNLTVPEVIDYPHAPWWHHTEKESAAQKNRAELIERYNPNTNSALVGMLVKYSSCVAKEFLEQATSVVIEKINSGYEFGQCGMLSDIYFVNALEDEALKSSLLKSLMGDGKLMSVLEGSGTESAYKMCRWIDSPRHPYYNIYQAEVQRNLDFLIASREEDGSWAPNRSWGDEEVWERVCKRLKGLLTMKFLWTLKTLDRIETN